VTHDQAEAMALGDRVAVLNRGAVEQVDTPERVYRLPTTLFVAGFIGSPAMNLVEASVGEGGLCVGGLRLPLPPDAALGSHVGRTVALGIRPGDLEDASFADPGLPTLDVVAHRVERLGSQVDVSFGVDASSVSIDDHPDLGAPGTSRLLATVDHRTTVIAGAPVRLAFDPDRLHLFDRLTGRSLREGGR
jgi:multiple sugar transport system ATP-binding protein